MKPSTSPAALRHRVYIDCQFSIYYAFVTKRLIDIDDALLEQARIVTGAATMKETVNAALRHTVEAELRLRHAQRLANLDGIDLADDEIMDAAWR